MPAVLDKVAGSEDPIVIYIAEHSLRLHEAQERLIEVTMKHELEFKLSSADEIQLLCNLCKLIKAKKTLDIGVYTGYSAMSIAMALPEDGSEINEELTNIGKPFWKEVGVYEKIDLKIAPAVQTLEKLVADGQSETFDFAFIDANKDQQDQYYELCLKLVRPGGIIALDNTLWSAKVLDSDTNDPLTKAIQAVNKKLHWDERVDISFMRMGDGTTLCFKR